jgi:hypothetical protein
MDCLLQSKNLKQGEGKSELGQILTITYLRYFGLDQFQLVKTFVLSEA